MTLLSDPWLQRLSNILFNQVGKFFSPQWDKRLLGLRSRPIRTIFDIGANQGQFSRQMVRLFPQAQIYAFEPLPIPFQSLSRWAQNRPTLKVFNLALGDETTMVTINQHLYFHAASSLLTTTELCETVYPMLKPQSPLTVPQLRLDDWLAQEQLELKTEILLKLDVQGYEDRVLRGGEQIFARADAVIIEVSLDQLYQGQACFRDIFKQLDGWGYQYAGNFDQMLAGDGHVRYFNALFWRSP